MAVVATTHTAMAALLPLRRGSAAAYKSGGSLSASSKEWSPCRRYRLDHV